MVVQIEAAEAAKKEAQKAKKVASKKGGRGGGGCRNSSSQVSCDWLARGHVTPSSPLIGRSPSPGPGRGAGGGSTATRGSGAAPSCPGSPARAWGTAPWRSVSTLVNYINFGQMCQQLLLYVILTHTDVLIE